MNKTYIVIIVILVLVAAYFAFGPKSAQSPVPVEETPSETPGAKLNINVICEGALAYMSFPDGASADAFVAECKEGKHPEVVEKYKADNNLGDGKAI